jgi:hypothetical protein
MDKIISLTEDEFDAQYTPIVSASGEQVRPGEYLGDRDSKQLWTVLDIDGNVYLQTGWHFVNRLGYMLTEESWTQETEAVWFLSSDNEDRIGGVEDSEARVLINGHLTGLLAECFGWNAEGDEDDDKLNELTHSVADLIRGVVNESEVLTPTTKRDGPWKISWEIDDTDDSATPLEAA